jgi:hypothetical protein
VDQICVEIAGVGGSVLGGNQQTLSLIGVYRIGLRFELDGRPNIGTAGTATSFEP